MRGNQRGFFFNQYSNIQKHFFKELIPLFSKEALNWSDSKDFDIVVKTWSHFILVNYYALTSENKCNVLIASRNTSAAIEVGYG